MGNGIRYQEFVRLFARHGVEVEKLHGTHIRMRKIIDGKMRIYIAVASHGRMVDECYVVKARRRFELLPENGVSDKEFFRG